MATNYEKSRLGRGENIFKICHYFIQRGIDESRPITQIKLQKLLYFAQGVYLVFNDGNPLFSDELYAWKYGPVAVEVYHKYKVFGNNPISESAITIQCKEEPSIYLEGWKVLPHQVIEFLDSVWTEFGKYTGFELVELTHLPESPWYEIYKRFDGEIPNSQKIPLSRMKMYFDNTVTAGSGIPVSL